jgi:hypothetical protein
LFSLAGVLEVRGAWGKRIRGEGGCGRRTSDKPFGMHDADGGDGDAGFCDTVAGAEATEHGGQASAHRSEEGLWVLGESGAGFKNRREVREGGGLTAYTGLQEWVYQYG